MNVESAKSISDSAVLFNAGTLNIVSAANRIAAASDAIVAASGSRGGEVVFS